MGFGDQMRKSQLYQTAARALGHTSSPLRACAASSVKARCSAPGRVQRDPVQHARHTASAQSLWALPREEEGAAGMRDGSSFEKLIFCPHLAL